MRFFFSVVSERLISISAMVLMEYSMKMIHVMITYQNVETVLEVQE